MGKLIDLFNPTSPNLTVVEKKIDTKERPTHIEIDVNADRSCTIHAFWPDGGRITYEIDSVLMLDNLMYALYATDRDYAQLSSNLQPITFTDDDRAF